MEARTERQTMECNTKVKHLKRKIKNKGRAPGTLGNVNRADVVE